MRELKFRVWDKINKKYYYHTIAELVFNIYADMHWGLTNVIWEQFTGLKDKNGKEIYEGDVIKSENGFYDIVGWSDDICGEYGCVGFSGVNGSSDGIFKYGEVVGNIYENPELLEKK